MIETLTDQQLASLIIKLHTEHVEKWGHDRLSTHEHTFTDEYCVASAEAMSRENLTVKELVDGEEIKLERYTKEPWSLKTYINGKYLGLFEVVDGTYWDDESQEKDMYTQKVYELALKYQNVFFPEAILEQPNL